MPPDNVTAAARTVSSGHAPPYGATQSPFVRFVLTGQKPEWPHQSVEGVSRKRCADEEHFSGPLSFCREASDFAR